MDKDYTILDALPNDFEDVGVPKAKYIKCNHCGFAQCVNDAQCPECGSYDLEELYLTRDELEAKQRKGELW